MIAHLLLNAAEDLPENALVLANARDGTIVEWVGVSGRQLRPYQITCVVPSGGRYGETLRCIPAVSMSKLTAVVTKPSSPPVAFDSEGDGQLEP